MRRSLAIVVSAMILAGQLGSPLGAAVPTTEQLSLISAYLNDNDVQALRAYLLSHPELLVEDSQLAELLREFMDQSETVTNFIGLEPDLRDSLEAAAPAARAAQVPGGVLY